MLWYPRLLHILDLLVLGTPELLSQMAFFFFSAEFPFQLDHHLILLLVVQLYMNFILKLSRGRGVLSTEDRYLNFSKYQMSAVENSFKDFFLLNVALNF